MKGPIPIIRVSDHIKDYEDGDVKGFFKTHRSRQSLDGDGRGLADRSDDLVLSL